MVYGAVLVLVGLSTLGWLLKPSWGELAGILSVMAGTGLVLTGRRLR